MVAGVAVIGAGRIARQAHIPAWTSLGEFANVIWIVDKNVSAARSLARDFDVPNVSADTAPALSDSQVDIVDICTPASTHLTVAQQAITAGKHIIIEKPAALNADDALKIADDADKAGVRAVVAENWLHSDAFLAASQWIAADGIGSIRCIESRHASPFWDYADGDQLPDSDELGYLFAAGSHNIACAMELAGPVSSVAGYANCAPKVQSEQPHDKEFVLCGRFEAGLLMSLVCLGRSHHLGERELWFRVTGDRGVIEFDVWGGWAQMMNEHGLVKKRNRVVGRGFGRELWHALRFVAGETESALTVRKYVEVQRLIEAAYRSARGSSVEIATDRGPEWVSP